MGYLDTGGLSHFWGTVKAALLGKQDKLTPDETIAMQGGGIGVKTPVKPVTRAEYDALAGEEKQANIVYLVEEPPWTPVPLSIQEYDTEGGWHVRKWSDGYAEMIITFNSTTTYAADFITGITRSTINAIPEPPLELLETYKDNYILNRISNAPGWMAMDRERPVMIFSDKTSRAVTMTREIIGRWK